MGQARLPPTLPPTPPRRRVRVAGPYQAPWRLKIRRPPPARGSEARVPARVAPKHKKNNEMEHVNEGVCFIRLIRIRK